MHAYRRSLRNFDRLKAEVAHAFRLRIGNAHTCSYFRFREEGGRTALVAEVADFDSLGRVVAALRAFFSGFVAVLVLGCGAVLVLAAALDLSGAGMSEVGEDWRPAGSPFCCWLHSRLVFIG